MNFEQAKDQVAVKNGHANWKIAECLVGCKDIDKMYTEASDIYANSEAIEFADWLNKLSPSQKVSVWSKDGSVTGIFTMDNEQLFDKFKLETRI